MSIKGNSNLDFEQKLHDFSELLSKIEGVNDNQRKLWIEIYHNAITDRQNAYTLFTRLVDIVQDKSAEHAVHGRTLTSYIERMSKANEQIIRLAELVAKSENKNEDIDAEEIFKKISQAGG